MSNRTNVNKKETKKKKKEWMGLYQHKAGKQIFVIGIFSCKKNHVSKLISKLTGLNGNITFMLNSHKRKTNKLNKIIDSEESDLYLY